MRHTGLHTSSDLQAKTDKGREKDEHAEPVVPLVGTGRTTDEHADAYAATKHPATCTEGHTLTRHHCCTPAATLPLEPVCPQDGVPNMKLPAGPSSRRHVLLIDDSVAERDFYAS